MKGWIKFVVTLVFGLAGAVALASWVLPDGGIARHVLAGLFGVGWANLTVGLALVRDWVE